MVHISVTLSESPDSSAGIRGYLLRGFILLFSRRLAKSLVRYFHIHRLPVLAIGGGAPPYIQLIGPIFGRVDLSRVVQLYLHLSPYFRFKPVYCLREHLVVSLTVQHNDET